MSRTGVGARCYLRPQVQTGAGSPLPGLPRALLGFSAPSRGTGSQRLLGNAARVWGSAGQPGGGSGRGPFSRDRSARRLSLNLRSDRSIRYFPLLPENSILGLELGPRLNLSGNQRGGDRDTEMVRDTEMERQ